MKVRYGFVSNSSTPAFLFMEHKFLQIRKKKQNYLVSQHIVDTVIVMMSFLLACHGVLLVIMRLANNSRNELNH